LPNQIEQFFKEDSKMASNPIQRRARQSFLIGFLIALVIMACIVAVLFMRINTLSEEKEALASQIALKTEVYVLADDIKSGDPITEDSFVSTTIIDSEIDSSNYFDPYSFETNDETGEAYAYYSKVDLVAGSLVPTNVVYKDGEGTTDDERIVEYNMIVLPSLLSNGDYIDIRLRLANGQDLVVLPKIRVEACTEDAIWIKVGEYEINAMNSVIIDSYLAVGSKLYATKLTEPGMQEALTATYPINNDILQEMNSNPNILAEAKQALVNRWTDYTTSERQTIEGYIEEETSEDRASTVASGTQSEVSDIATVRSDYVSSVEGTDIIGIDSLK
jgi:hypothetical protein